MWITIKYVVGLDSDNVLDQKIMGHTFSAVSEAHLVGKFREYQWQPIYISELIVNKTVLNEGRREDFYSWLNEITVKVDEENEAREKADEESEKNDDGSGTKSERMGDYKESATTR
ncbi:hypothetical protein NLX69_24170 [Rossellomorea sp. BNER]|nr:hypothetical protein [Rossellomorea sp. BNER]